MYSLNVFVDYTNDSNYFDVSLFTMNIYCALVTMETMIPYFKWKWKKLFPIFIFVILKKLSWFSALLFISFYLYISYISELLSRDYIKKIHPTNISYHTCNINKSTWHMSSQNHFRCFSDGKHSNKATTFPVEIDKKK